MKKLLTIITLLFAFIFNANAQIDKYTCKEQVCMTEWLGTHNNSADVKLSYGIVNGDIAFLTWFTILLDTRKHKTLTEKLENNAKYGMFNGKMCDKCGVMDIAFKLDNNTTLEFSVPYLIEDVYDLETNMDCKRFEFYISSILSEVFEKLEILFKHNVKSFIVKMDGKTISPVIKANMKIKNTMPAMAKDLTKKTSTVSSEPSASTSKKQNTSKTTNSTTNKANSQNVNGHEYVDLGLKSGTMWATCNVGAKNPHEIGMYFAWGEVEGTYTAKKKNGKGFRADNYKYMKKGNSNDVTKYCSNDKKYTLEDSDDAASVNWGRSWCMPTYEQAKELVDNCTYSFVKVQGRTCIKLVSKINNRYIIIPCGGDAHFQEISSKDSCFSIWLKDRIRINWGSDCSAAHMNSVGDASAIYVHWNTWPRYEGLNIRPVLKSTK